MAARTLYTSLKKKEAFVGYSCILWPYTAQGNARGWVCSGLSVQNARHKSSRHKSSRQNVLTRCHNEPIPLLPISSNASSSSLASLNRL
eukprot:858450-Pelagomonas_calceolata.AAC.5